MTATLVGVDHSVALAFSRRLRGRPAIPDGASRVARAGQGLPCLVDAQDAPIGSLEAGVSKAQDARRCCGKVEAKLGNQSRETFAEYGMSNRHIGRWRGIDGLQRKYRKHHPAPDHGVVQDREADFLLVNRTRQLGRLEQMLQPRLKPPRFAKVVHRGHYKPNAASNREGGPNGNELPLRAQEQWQDAMGQRVSPGWQIPAGDRRCS
jgi:hypothetical protein